MNNFCLVRNIQHEHPRCHEGTFISVLFDMWPPLIHPPFPSSRSSRSYTNTEQTAKHSNDRDIHSGRARLDEEENKTRIPAAEGDRAIVTERSMLLYHQAHLPLLAFMVDGAYLRGSNDGIDSKWCGNDNHASAPQASTTRPARAAAAKRKNSCCSHQYTLSE